MPVVQTDVRPIGLCWALTPIKAVSPSVRLHDTELTGFTLRRQGKAAVYSVRGLLKGPKQRGDVHDAGHATSRSHGERDLARRLARW